MKKENANERLQFYAVVELIVIMYLLPIPQYFYPSEVKTVVFQGIFLILNLPFLGFLGLKMLCQKKKRISVIWIYVCCFLGISVLSVVFAENRHFAIFGRKERAEGLLVIISYYLIFYVLCGWHKN